MEKIYEPEPGIAHILTEKNSLVSGCGEQQDILNYCTKVGIDTKGTINRKVDGVKYVERKGKNEI